MDGHVLIPKFSLIFFIFFIPNIDAFENKVKFLYKGDDISFKEELVITNVTSDEHLELGQDVRKWKSLTLNDRSYAVGITDTGICLLKSNGERFNSVCSDITEIPIKILDVQLYKIWNSITFKFDLAILILLKGGSLSWFTINDKLELKLLSKLELDKDTFLFDIYPINSIDYLFTLAKSNETNTTTLNIYKSNVIKGKFAYLWPEQTIILESPSTSFTLNNHNEDYYLSITQKSQNHIKIYKKLQNTFKLSYKIPHSDSDILHSFSIGPKTYLLTNGKNSSIYKLTKSGPIKESLNEKNVTSWLPIPVMTYKEEIFILAQKEIYHDSHISHSIDLIHSKGFDFDVYHEIPCFYFNQLLHGFDCLVEEDEHLVELDLSAVIPFDKFIGVIISRKDHHSQLVKIYVDVNKIPNPKEIRIKHLQKIKEKIMKVQEKLKLKELSVVDSSKPQGSFKNKVQGKQRESNSEIVDEFMAKAKVIKSSIENLRKFTEKFGENRSIKINKLVINGDVEVKGVGNFNKVDTNTLNNEESLNDVVQINNLEKIHGKKVFNNLITKHINFESLNNIDRSNLIFVKNQSSVILNGNVRFKNDLEIINNVTTISNKVNNVIFEKEVVDVQTNQDSLFIDSIQINDHLDVENINSTPFEEHLSSNLLNENETDGFIKDGTFENLELTNLNVTSNMNNDNFSEVLKRTIMKDMNDIKLGSLEVDTLDTLNLEINFLNDLKFPDDFVLGNFNEFNITGFKKFKTKPSINSLNITNLINGIKPSNILTLSTNQNISGNITFKNLEFIKPNHTVNEIVLNQGDFIENLEVTGDVVIENYLGNINLENYLRNFLWKDSDTKQINSTKYFKDLFIETLYVNKINNDSSSLIINKSKNQTLNINDLENVTIENLKLEGKINEVNVKDLLENSIKLNSNQNISSFLTFNDLNVTNLTILKTLNNLPLKDFLYTNEPKHLTLFKLSNIKVLEIIANETFGNIENFIIEDLQKNILRKNGNQEIFGDVYVENLKADRLNVTKINDLYTRELFDPDYYISLMERRFLEDKIRIKNFNILGNLTLKEINNVKMDDLINSLPFTKENNLQPNITFRDNVKFNGIKINNINGIDFNQFINNLVFKNESKLKLSGTKAFKNGFRIKKYIETQTLNGIPLENVLRKGNNQNIRGPIIINGHVIIEHDLKLKEINEVSLDEFKTINITNDLIHVNGDVLFNESAHIKNLNLHGNFNDKNLSQVFENMISLNDDIKYKGSITFKDKVTFKQDLDVSDSFNNLDLKHLQDIVFINQDDFIEGLVSFKNPVKVNGTITVESDLLTDTIMGINPRDWLKNGVFINQEIIGKLTFQNITVSKFINIEFLNNMNTSRFIPLISDQKIIEGIVFENLILNENLNVKGLVNNVDLKEEYLNTVLNKGRQTISSEIKFNNNVLIYEDLTLKGKSKNFDFNYVVFINQDSTVNRDLNFSSQIETNYLEVDGFINEINFTDWHTNTLKKNSKQRQNVSASMTFNNLIIEDYSYGSGLISGLNLKNVTDCIGYNLAHKKNIENEFKIDYLASCKDINHLKQISNKQIYKFKYLEPLLTLRTEKSINFFSHFENNDEHYLIVNEKNSCNSTILQWNYQDFTQLLIFKTGIIQQLITMKSFNKLYLIGLSSNCNFSKTNLWILEDNIIQNHQTLDNLNLLQESLIPNTFYGLTNTEVREYKIYVDSDVHIYRKWKINFNENMAFVPRGLKTGPALRDGQKLIKLERNEEIEIDFGIDVQETLLGETVTLKNKIIPGKNGEIVVLNIGPSTFNSLNKVMVAVSSREGSSIKTKSDSIKIYTDAFKGTLFQKIPTYKPSAITSLNLQNGETLLIFFEDNKILHVYAYKGIEGFKHLKSAKLRGQKIVKMKLPINSFESSNMLAVLNNNEVNMLKVVMGGSERVNSEEIYCEL